MSTPEEEAILIEAVTTAHRARSADQIEIHPAWLDLDAAGREQAFEVTRVVRRMEAALDRDGLSTTARAVLARLGGA